MSVCAHKDGDIDMMVKMRTVTHGVHPFHSCAMHMSVYILYFFVRARARVRVGLNNAWVHRGASIKYLSQYPHEDEILFPPLSNLEVMADAHEEETHMGLVTVLPLRVNANVKSLTINQLKDRRKTLHVEMLKDLVNETRVTLQDHSLHIFDAMDADHDGYVDSRELSAALQGYGGAFVQQGLEAMGENRVDKARFKATVQPVLEDYMRDCRSVM